MVACTAVSLVPAVVMCVASRDFSPGPSRPFKLRLTILRLGIASVSALHLRDIGIERFQGCVETL